MQSARPPRCWSELLLLKRQRWIGWKADRCFAFVTAPEDDGCSGRRAACKFVTQPTRLPLQKFLPTRPEVEFHLGLVDEKRTRFLEHLVEFFGGHFSD